MSEEKDQRREKAREYAEQLIQSNRMFYYGRMAALDEVIIDLACERLEKIDLLARYLEAASWSVFDSQDPELIRLHEIQNNAYVSHRSKSFTIARLEGHRAVILEVLGGGFK